MTAVPARAVRGIALASLALLLLGACATEIVSSSKRALSDLVRSNQKNAYADAAPSDRTLALVDRLGYTGLDYGTVTAELVTELPDVPNHERHLARAELLFWLASRASSVSNTELARSRFLEAAIEGLRALQSECHDPERAALHLAPFRGAAVAATNYALTAFLQLAIEHNADIAALARDLRAGAVTLEWRMNGAWRLEDFDVCHCAELLDFEGFRHRYRRPGAGVPLVLIRAPSRELPPHSTPEGIYRSATAVLDLDPAGAPVLSFYDPRTTRTIALQRGIRAPLAADFTAPFALLVDHGDLEAIENRSFFNADAAGHEGLFLLEDYDPDRRPVVMVHGLWSSPLTWRDLTNDVFGDPTLHGRYQVWHYFYATGTPLLENARQLRETLTRTRRELDPELDDFASQEWVLVGHSMGGLLSRIVLQRSGDAIWRTLFEANFDDVEPHLEDEDKELARGLYFWEALPFVRRAVFIAAPHRGSAMADSFIGRLGSSLMYVPRRLRRLVDRIRGRSGVRVEVPTSVDELSMRHPVMQALAKLPLKSDLTFHSIMGDVSGSQQPEERTDGVVPYLSSRLDGAASELVVPGAAHDVHFDPRASAEVRRILRDAPR